jgi:hypothetical protein
MEHEGLPPCSQQSITEPYPEPARHSRHPHTISFTSILELSPHLFQDLARSHISPSSAHISDLSHVCYMLHPFHLFDLIILINDMLPRGLFPGRKAAGA